jgi:hypothetical protein
MRRKSRMKRDNSQRFFAGWLQVAPVMSLSCAGIGFFAVFNYYGELKLSFREKYLFIWGIEIMLIIR